MVAALAALCCNVLLNKASGLPGDICFEQNAAPSLWSLCEWLHKLSRLFIDFST
jgi:hypothetical protein